MEKTGVPIDSSITNEGIQTGSISDKLRSRRPKISENARAIGARRKPTQVQYQEIHQAY
jgi:hypothetical protein